MTFRFSISPIIRTQSEGILVQRVIETVFCLCPARFLVVFFDKTILKIPSRSYLWWLLSECWAWYTPDKQLSLQTPDTFSRILIYNASFGIIYWILINGEQWRRIYYAFLSKRTKTWWVRLGLIYSDSGEPVFIQIGIVLLRLYFKLCTKNWYIYLYFGTFIVSTFGTFTSWIFFISHFLVILYICTGKYCFLKYISPSLFANL